MEIRLGEELLTPEQVRYQLRACTCYQEMWNFAPGLQKLTHFGLRIFRYAELVGYEGELSPDMVKIIAVNAPFDTASSNMTSDDEKLNRIWALCKNSIRSTNMDIYTDCFSRERIAYEADGYINMLSNFAVTRNRETCLRFLEYIIRHPTWPCEWMQILIPIFHDYYWESGDKEMIDRHFDRLLKQASFRHLIRDGLVKKFPLMAIIDHPFTQSDNYDIENEEFFTCSQCSGLQKICVFWLSWRRKSTGTPLRRNYSLRQPQSNRRSIPGCLIAIVVYILTGSDQAIVQCMPGYGLCGVICNRENCKFLNPAQD